jgi:hypothetical protein
MFSRNHNIIAESLLSINEEGKYNAWDTLDKEQQEWYDHALMMGSSAG